MDMEVERSNDSLLEDMFEDGDLGEPKTHVSFMYILFLQSNEKPQLPLSKLL